MTVFVPPPTHFFDNNSNRKMGSHSWIACGNFLNILDKNLTKKSKKRLHYCRNEPII